MAEPTSCQQHPSVETRLRCANCDTPICPRCATDAPVGMRCPDCARPRRDGGLRRRPDQVARAAGVAVLGALVGGVVMGGVQVLLRFGGLIAAYLVGLLLGRRVRRAARGNTVDVIRGIAIAGALGAALVAEVVIGLERGGTFLNLYTVLRAGIAVFGAWSALR